MNSKKYHCGLNVTNYHSMLIKTCFLHFSNHNPKNIQRLHIFIDNLPIIEKKSTKFLGVILDSNLTWTDHYRKVTTSVSKAIGILYKLKHILTKKTLVMLYNSLVLPHITYCNIVWGNSKQSKLNSILILQKRPSVFAHIQIILPIPIQYSTN